MMLPLQPYQGAHTYRYQGIDQKIRVREGGHIPNIIFSHIYLIPSNYRGDQISLDRHLTESEGRPADYQ